MRRGEVPAGAMSVGVERGAPFLPVAGVQELGPALLGRMRAAAGLLRGENFAAWIDPAAVAVVELALGRIGASEGSIWLMDAEGANLRVAWNNGPRAGDVVGFCQPIGEGIVGMVHMTERPFCENRVYQHASQCKTLDRSLDVLTCAMIVVPLRIASLAKGVISAVRLKPNRPDAPDPPGFLPEDVSAIEVAANALARMAEWQIMAEIGAWKHAL